MDLQSKLGITYIFITHDIATVRAISDEIVVMYQGKVVEQGLKTEVLSPPYPDYTQLLLSSVPELMKGEVGYSQGREDSKLQFSVPVQPPFPGTSPQSHPKWRGPWLYRE